MGWRGTEALQKMDGRLVHKLIHSNFMMLHNFKEYLFYKSILLIGFVLIIHLLWTKRKNISLKSWMQKDQILLFILLVSFLWTSLVMFFAPFKILRYIMPILPILSLFIPYIILKIHKNIKFWILSVILLIYVAVALRPGQQIEYLYRGTMQQQGFNLKPEIPAIIGFQDPSKWEIWWMCDVLLPYLSDEQKYEFARSDEKILEKINKYDEVFVITNEECDALFIDNQYRIENKFNLQLDVYAIGYLIRRIND
jgi:hypothetical protein